MQSSFPVFATSSSPPGNIIPLRWPAASRATEYLAFARPLIMTYFKKVIPVICKHEKALTN